MSEVRLLSKDYREYCDSVVRSKTRLGGSIPLSEDRYNELKDNDAIRSIGYFEDNKLISWINVSFQNTSNIGKFWVITGFFIVEQGNYFSFKRPEFGSLLQKAFDLAESNGYFQYFYCVSDRISKVYERQWSKYNPLNYHGRYDLTTQEIVPPNTKPNSELAWRLMGCELKPDSIHLKSRILKGHTPHGK